MSTESDPIVEILRLAYRRGLALRQKQSKNETSPTDNTARLSDMEFTGDTMNTQRLLETIDAIQIALEGLERALDKSDRRTIDMELETTRLELNNLRELVEKLNDTDAQ
jgi:hypothetical protein